MDDGTYIRITVKIYMCMELTRKSLLMVGAPLGYYMHLVLFLITSYL
jgi:hypothetical protein